MTTTMAGAAYRASCKATIAVVVDLPHCRQQQTSVFRDVGVGSCDWAASGCIPQSWARMVGSNARAKSRPRVIRGSICASMLTSVDDMLRGDVQGPLRRGLGGPFLNLVQSGGHRAARLPVGLQSAQKGSP